MFKLLCIAFACMKFFQWNDFDQLNIKYLLKLLFNYKTVCIIIFINHCIYKLFLYNSTNFHIYECIVFLILAKAYLRSPKIHCQWR